MTPTLPSRHLAGQNIPHAAIVDVRTVTALIEIVVALVFAWGGWALSRRDKKESSWGVIVASVLLLLFGFGGALGVARWRMGRPALGGGVGRRGCGSSASGGFFREAWEALGVPPRLDRSR